MFCGECGTQNPDANQFCRNCGKPLTKREPVAQPAAQPVVRPPAQPVYQQPPATTVLTQQPVAAAAPSAPASQKRQWNWLGIVSVPLGILSLGILPVLFALGALVLGTCGLILFRKATGRIGISSVIGIVFGLASLLITALA